MEYDDSLSGEFQRSTRMPLDAVVRLHFQGTVAYQNGFAANVSATGMFVKHPAPPPLGTQLVFEFNLGSDRKPVQGAGEVVWVRDKYLGPGQPAGVGIRFLQLDSQSRDHIAEALFDYLEQSLTDDSLLDANELPFGPEKGSAAAGAATAFGAAPVTADSGRAYDYPSAAPAGPTVREPDAGYREGAAVAEASPEPYAEAFDFAALDRLPRRDPETAGSAPATAATNSGAGRRAYSVFSPLDEADSQTADIVREALREEEPMPSLAAAASAASESGGPRAWILALILLLVAGGGYFAWQQWGAAWFAGRSAAGTVVEAAAAPEPTPTRTPEPLTAAPEPGTTLAEAVGVDPKAVSPAAAPPLSAPAPATPDEEVAAPAGAAPLERPVFAAPTFADDAASALAGESRGAAVRGAAATPPRPETVQEPADNQPRPPAAAAEAAATAGTPTPRAQRLTGIEWRESAEAAGQTVLVLQGDGLFASGAFSYAEIGGENPRVLIKLKGMQSAYRGASPQGGGALVRGVRTGFHVTANGNEIHVVVDLARKGVRVASLLPVDSALTLVLAP